jgi:prepilin-type N-terminal cleavage/methylation domain-containing protein/prepilin-type processing-associated H-X9-DG protein
MKPPGKSGFTLLEILVSLSIVAGLSVSMVTVAYKARERGRSSSCLANLRQWGVALHLYSADHGGCLPRRGQGVQLLRIIDRPDDWFNALPPYLGDFTYQELDARGVRLKPGDRSIFVCPSAKDESNGGHFLSYGMNMHLSRWDKPEPSRMVNLGCTENLVFMADSPGGYASTVPSAARYSVPARHDGCANILFVDGHAESFNGDHLGCGSGEKSHSDVRWKVEENDGWNPF